MDKIIENLKDYDILTTNKIGIEKTFAEVWEEVLKKLDELEETDPDAAFDLLDVLFGKNDE